MFKDKLHNARRILSPRAWVLIVALVCPIAPVQAQGELAAHDVNIDGDLAAHDANIDADLVAHDANIDAVLRAHDVNIDADLAAHDAEIKALLGMVQATLDFKVDFELEQALLTCSCTPSLYIPAPDGKLDHAQNLVNTEIDLVATLLDPDLENKIPQARCYADEAARLLSYGSFKKSCLALGSAIQLLDGHFDDDDSDGEDLCLEISDCSDD